MCRSSLPSVHRWWRMSRSRCGRDDLRERCRACASRLRRGVELDGDLADPVPLLTGFTSPERVTLSLRVVEPTDPLEGCAEVAIVGVTLVTVSTSPVVPHRLVDFALAGSPEYDAFQ